MESTRDNTYDTEKSDVKVRFALPPLSGRSMLASPPPHSQDHPSRKPHEMSIPLHKNDDHSLSFQRKQDCSHDVENRAMCISPTPEQIASLDCVMVLPSLEKEQSIEPDHEERPLNLLSATALEKSASVSDSFWGRPKFSNDEPQCDRSAPKSNSDRCQEENAAVCLRDIVGHAAVKLRIDELLLPLGLPDSVAETVLSGIRSTPATILLYGPPGCGKTRLVQALAGAAQAALVSIAPSDVLSKFVGESESSIRDIFRKAAEQAAHRPSQCAVVFFDEIDALGQSRGNMGTGEGEGCSRRVLAELLLQLNLIANQKSLSIRDFDGSNTRVRTESEDTGSDAVFIPAGAQSQDSRVRIIVAAATNRLEDIDPALVRRFGIQLEVGLPEYKDRKKMLTRHLSSVLNNLSVHEFHTLASVTEGWSGSNLEDLARAAAMRPVHECLHHAAVLRRRAGKLEQRGGDVSGQDDSPETSDLIANYLIGAVQSLRSVTMEDFGGAIRVMTDRELPLSFQPLLKGSKKRVREEHYDSSSSDNDSM